MRFVQIRNADPNGKRALSRAFERMKIGDFFWILGCDRPVRYDRVEPGKIYCSLPSRRYVAYFWEFVRPLTPGELKRFRKELAEASAFYNE
jgi:hypothetical protein